MNSKLVTFCLLVLAKSLLCSEIASNINGIWIDSTYLYRLKTTLSPRTAFLPFPELVSIQVNSKSKTIQFGYNFHEALDAAYGKFDKKSIFVPIERWPNSIELVAFQNEKIIVTSKDSSIHLRQVFDKVCNDTGNTYKIFTSLIGSMTIKGQYKDRLGNKCSIDNDYAILNGEKRKYLIEADYVEFTPLDIICFEDSTGRCNESYGFVTNGNLLQMYEYDDYTKRIGTLFIELVRDEKR